MKYVKLSFSILFLSFAGMVVGVHRTGQFFPWIHFAVLISTLSIFGSIISRNQCLNLVLTMIVLWSVCIRLYLYLTPSSLVGMDPDKFAAGVNQILQEGSTTALATESSPYAMLSAFHLLNGVVSLVSGFEGGRVLIAVPILMGVLLPLTSSALATQVSSEPETVLLAAVFAASATIGFLYSYWPIVQVIAVLIWYMVLIFLIKTIVDNDWRAYLGAYVGGIVLIFAHKISLLIPLLILVTFVALVYIRCNISPENNTKIFNMNQTTISFILTLILCLVIQWFLITRYGLIAIFGRILPLLTGGAEFVSSSADPVAATSGNSGLYGILVRRAHYLVVVLLVTLTGIWFWLQRKDQKIILMISAAAVPIGLAVISIVGVRVTAPNRLLLFGVPVFSVLIGLGIQQLAMKTTVNRQVIITVIILAIFVSQAGTAQLAPDYPGEPREYLTEGEIEAKSHLLSVSTEPVSMDHYYAQEQVNVSSDDAIVSGSVAPGITPMNEVLYDGTLTQSDYGTLLLREHADVIWFDQGHYHLTWEPIEWFSTEPGHNKHYDNGHAAGFKQK